jgi:hypothetical protein
MNFFLLISIQSMRQFLRLIDNCLKTFVRITYFWHFLKTFFLKILNTQNVLATTKRNMNLFAHKNKILVVFAFVH